MSCTKQEYKGYNIEISREACQGGWDMVYFDVFREVDGLHIVGDFSESEDTLEYFVETMKSRIDEFIKTQGSSEDMMDDFVIGDI